MGGRNRPYGIRLQGISPLSPIALFDSGAGGIGVLREVVKLLPREQFLYFGDAANAPYGERPIGEVRRLAFAHAERLLAKAKALVIACNTATAVAAEELRRRYPDRIIVGMEPALRPAALCRPFPRVLVLATAATLHERKFAELMQKCAETALVLPLAAPELVTLVERGLADSPEMRRYLARLLAPLRADPPDAVVLGCTHFPFAKRAIAEVLGGDILFFDGAAGTARQLARRLHEAGLLAPAQAAGGVRITASDPTKLPLYRALFGG